MKKVIFAIAIVTAFAACNNSATEETTTDSIKVDSPIVKIDSPVVKIDSPVVKIDSPVVKVDSPAKKM
ncbi:MAG: hypothetical protein V4556_12940 [Bacteroidota bacterium]